MSLPVDRAQNAVAERKAFYERESQSVNSDLGSGLACANTSVTGAAEEISPRTQLELEKNAPLLLSLIAQVFDRLGKDVKTIEYLGPYFDTAGHEEAVKTIENKENTENKENEENTKILSAMHTILKDAPEDPKTENETVEKIKDIYNSAKFRVDLNQPVLGKPPLLITALYKKNLSALCWLSNMGATFPLEYELLLALAAPDTYQAFKVLIEKRNKETKNFIDFYYKRYSELLNQSNAQHMLDINAEKKERAAIAIEIDKQNETVSNSIFQKCISLTAEKCSDVGLLLMSKLTPNQLMTKIKDLCLISIVETQVSFMQLKAVCIESDHGWLVYVYYSCKSRKEAKKSEIQTKLNNLPPSIKNEFGRLLKLEQACFDLVFKKVKAHLEKHHSQDMRTYDQFIPDHVLKLMGDSDAIKSFMPNINQAYSLHLETVVVPKLQQEISSMFNDTYAAYPEQLSYASPAKEQQSLTDLLISLKTKWAMLDISSIKYFYAIRCSEVALNNFVSKISLMYQTVKEGLLKFKPSKEEMKRASDITQEEMYQNTLSNQTVSPRHEEILQQEKRVPPRETLQLQRLMEEKQRKALKLHKQHFERQKTCPSKHNAV